MRGDPTALINSSARVAFAARCEPVLDWAFAADGGWAMDGAAELAGSMADTVPTRGQFRGRRGRNGMPN